MKGKGEVTSAFSLPADHLKKEVPLYELPRGDHAGEVGNECDLGKTWPEA